MVMCICLPVTTHIPVIALPLICVVFVHAHSCSDIAIPGHSENNPMMLFSPENVCMHTRPVTLSSGEEPCRLMHTCVLDNEGSECLVAPQLPLALCGDQPGHTE